MDIVQKKQEEINELLKEALDIQEEVKSIVNIVQQISEKFEIIGDNLTNSFKTVGTMVNSKAAKEISAYMIQNSKYQSNAIITNATVDIGLEAAGTLISSFGEMIGSTVSGIGNWFAARKEKKALAKLLEKKQELANEKQNKIKSFVPKIINKKNRVIELLKIDASVVINFEDKQRHSYIYKNCKGLFESYFIFENTELICYYLLDEFNAWLSGKHQSDNVMLKSSDIYLGCVNNLIEFSNLPMNSSKYVLPEDISIGANMLLTDMQISEFSKELDDVNLLSAKLANTKLLSTFFPFSTKAKRFKKYYKLHLSSSEQIKVYLKRKKMYIYFTVSLIVLIISFLYYFLFFI